MLETRVVKMLEVREGDRRLVFPLVYDLKDQDRFRLEACVGRSLDDREWGNLCKIHAVWTRSFVTDTYEKRVGRIMRAKGEDDENDAG